MEAKYDKIGKDYNLTRKADKLLTENLIRHLAPTKEGIYLDIGCGTGSYTNELQKRGYSFIGIDPSERMLEKARTLNSKIDWQLGTAEKTGLPHNHVNGIIGSLTIHHWTKLEKAFHELYAILKAKGKIVIFTATPEQLKTYWLNHYFPTMLVDSIAQMPTLKRLQTLMKSAGFERLETEKYFIQPDLEDMFLYCGKHKPEMYFDLQIRKGISSFSSLSNKEEVEIGLSRLKLDVESGKIHEIICKYDNQLGDYLYLTGSKTNR